MSTTDGWLELNFASCVIRYVRHAHWALLFYNPFVVRIVFVNYIYDMVVNTKFHKFYGRRSRVLYVFLMKDIPWVLPGSTGRFRSITILRADTI